MAEVGRASFAEAAGALRAGRGLAAGLAPGAHQRLAAVAQAVIRCEGDRAACGSLESNQALARAAWAAREAGHSDAAIADAEGAEDAVTAPIDAGLPSTAACLTVANAIWIEGQPDTNAPGTGWMGTASAEYAEFSSALVYVLEATGTWTFYFNTEHVVSGSLSATPLQVGVVYPVAFSDVVETMSIGTPKGNCYAAVGAYRLDEFSANLDPTVERKISSVAMAILKPSPGAPIIA